MTAPSCIKRGVRGAKPGVPHKKRQRPNTDTATPSVTLASTQSAETSASASPINSRSSHYLQPLAPGHNPISSAASVILRFEYCNSVLAGAPLSITAPLQPVQNAAARMISNFNLQIMSLHVCFNYTDYQLAGEFNSNYSPLFTPYSQANVLLIFETLYDLCLL